MDPELKDHLERMEARLAARPEVVEARLAASLEAMKARLALSSEALEARLSARSEAVQTRLLREFWKWARTADARYRQAVGQVSGLSERVGITEDRIAELESGTV